jgi:hypothetical protein
MLCVITDSSMTPFGSECGSFSSARAKARQAKAYPTKARQAKAYPTKA